MARGAFNKTGWVWTGRQGWKRIPRRLRRVKIVPMPGKSKIRKLRRIGSAQPKPAMANRTKAPNLAVEQGRADSAPIPTPKAEKPIARPLRQAWGGKYDALPLPELRQGHGG